MYMLSSLKNCFNFYFATPALPLVTNLLIVLPAGLEVVLLHVVLLAASHNRCSC